MDIIKQHKQVVSSKEQVLQFYRRNEDRLRSVFKSNLHNIEFDSTELAQLFDRYSNIDYIMTNDKALFGISARVNFKPSMHGMVTVRYERDNGYPTEFFKGIKAYQNESDMNRIVAAYHFQMDSDTDLNLQTAILINKKQFYLKIFNELEYHKSVYLHRTKDVQYFCIPFSYFAQQNIQHRVYDFT